MTEPIRLAGRQPSLPIRPGYAIPFEVDEDFFGVLTEEALEQASLNELLAIIRCWSNDYPAFAIWQAMPTPRGVHREPESLPLLYDTARDELRVVVNLDVEPKANLALESSLPALIEPIAGRWAARTTFEVDPVNERWLTVQASLPDLSRPASDLVRLGDELRAAFRALRSGVLTLQAARDLIAGGHAHALVGAREGVWLDVKAAPYRLAEDQHAWEFAKDVAAFANADGGVILVPARTAVVRGAEVIDSVGTLPGHLINEAQHRDVIAARVYPAPRGVEVAFVEDGDDCGQLYIFIPPQADGHKPFLVRGEPTHGRVLAHSVTVPWRDGDLTRFDEIGTIHAALRAYRSRIEVDEQVMERVWLASMQPMFRDAVRLARRAGLTVDVMHQGFSVQLPGDERAELFADHLSPGTEAFAIHSVMERLAPHGVPVLRTSGGFLVPDPSAE